MSNQENANAQTNFATTLSSPKALQSPQSVMSLTLGKGGATSSLAVGKKQVLSPPPKAGAFDVRVEAKPSEFRRFYDRGDLPLQVILVREITCLRFLLLKGCVRWSIAQSSVESELR